MFFYVHEYVYVDGVMCGTQYMYVIERSEFIVIHACVSSERHRTIQ